MSKTVLKVKWKNMLYFILIVLSILFGIIFSIYLYLDNKEYNKSIDSLSIGKDIISVIVDDEDTKTIEPPRGTSKFSEYYKYIKLGLNEVNMGPLMKINSDTIGWLEVKNTNINYPVLLKDNSYYKNHDYKEVKNKYGSIYLDSKVNTDTISDNNIIYSKLFKDIKSIIKGEWLDDSSNYVIKFSTNTYTALYQIVSIYKGDTYLESDIIDSSLYDFNTSISDTDKLITLVGGNYIVQGKLIKYKIY